MTQPLRKKGGLGRGLASLIPTGPADADSGPATLGPRMGSAAADVLIGGAAASGPDAAAMGAVYREIAPTDIEPNPRQPRQVFDEESLSELVHSIREFGLLQPIVVRAADGARDGARYQIVMGERRWRAAQEAGLATIPAIVRATDDDNLLRDALLENIHRVQLNPLEEAAAYQQLLDDFGATHEELARKIGRSRPHISNTLRLLNLPPAVQKRVAAGVLSAGHARALLGVENPEAQERLAGRIVAEGLSVRAVEEIVAIGADDSPPRRPARTAIRPPSAPALRHLADRLSDLFETRVKVELGQRKGKIVVEFATMGDLERIVKAMSLEVAGSEPSSDPAGSPE